MSISPTLIDYLENISRVVGFVRRTGKDEVLVNNKSRLKEWAEMISSLTDSEEMKDDLKSLLVALDEGISEEIIHFAERIISYGNNIEGIERDRGKTDVISGDYADDEVGEFSELSESVRYLKGVGKMRAHALEKLGVETVYDMLMFLPRDYEDRRETTRVEDVIPGESYTILARILEVDVKQTRSGKERVVVTATDGTQKFHINWWGMTYLADRLGRGEMLRIYGKADVYDKYIQFNNPEFDIGEEFDGINYGRIVPIYPLTEGLNQKVLRRIIKGAVKKYRGCVRSVIPDTITGDGLIPLQEAITLVHFPDELNGIDEIRRRLSLESIFLIQTVIALRRREFKDVDGVRIEVDGSLRKRFIKSLAFSLTESQRRVIEDLLSDMSADKPMQRLLQGDVGCGKTVVAVISALDVVEAGHQVVMMAPTEILARQHYERLRDILSPLNVEVGLLVGGQSWGERSDILNRVKKGEVKIVIGTHALIEEGVVFHNPGLVVIDEQHKFGVHQRTKLVKKGKGINLLVMTATPIPRTIALAVYGDLDISIIDEMPAGRKEIETFIYEEKTRDRVFDKVEKHLRDSGQGFIVYPLIEESDKLDVRAVEESFKYLAGERFVDFSVAVIHGRIAKEKQKETIDKFERGKIDLLLTTTVAEVGLDIRGANFIVIENVERFGLSQLHQLRGRIGRGGQYAYCYLVLGNNSTELARERVKIMVKSGDGFYIAEEDLRLRGPGEFLGVKQSGLPDYVLMAMMKYPDLIQQAKEMARDVLEKDPDLSDNIHSFLRERLLEEFRDRLEITFSG